MVRFDLCVLAMSIDSCMRSGSFRESSGGLPEVFRESSGGLPGVFRGSSGGVFRVVVMIYT